MKLKRVRFEVSFVLPEGARISDARDYVLDAVGCYRGSLRPPGSYEDDAPGDAMSSLDPDSIHVKRIGPITGRKREVPGEHAAHPSQWKPK